MENIHTLKTVGELIAELQKLPENSPIGEYWMAYETGNYSQYVILDPNDNSKVIVYLGAGCEMHTDEPTSDEWIEINEQQIYIKQSEENEDESDL